MTSLIIVGLIIVAIGVMLYRGASHYNNMGSAGCPPGQCAPARKLEPTARPQAAKYQKAAQVQEEFTGIPVEIPARKPAKKEASYEETRRELIAISNAAWNRGDFKKAKQIDRTLKEIDERNK
jgi:hypothetical protein